MLDPPGSPSDASRRIEPLDLLFLVVTFASCLWVIEPLNDINDVFWHILIGDQIRAGTPFSELGSTFSYSLDNPDWRTAAWGSELLMSWLYHLGGWGLLATTIRVGSIAGVTFVLWRRVLRRWPSRAVLLPFVLAMIALALTVQERPQSLSFVLIALTGTWWYRAVLDNEPPHWIIVGMTALVWANLHGLWVLLPAVMALAFVGRLLNQGLRDPKRVPMAAALLASLLGGCFTPLGPAGLLVPLRLQESASGLINEWAPTALFAWPGYTLLIMSGVMFYLLGKVRAASRGELLYAIAIVAFGLMATRNVTPSVLLLAPLLASLMFRGLGSRSTSSTSPKEEVRLRILAYVTTFVGLLAVALAVGLRDQSPPDALPVVLAQRLASEKGPVRLLNDYNWSGIALFYGGNNVQVGADGRADYYGPDFLNRYQDAVVFGHDVRPLVADLDPTHALVPAKSATAAILEDDGWTVVASDENHVLLVAP